MSSLLPAAIFLLVSFLQGLSTETSMVVVQGGFRERWNKKCLAKQGDGAYPQFDCHAESVDVGWEHISPHVDSVGFDSGQPHELFSRAESQVDDNSHFSGAESSFGEKRQPVFIEPKPKSRPQFASDSSSTRSGIKRTADEFSSRQLHRTVADLKQPWQTGPLACLFSKQKAFWNRPSSLDSFSSVGLADHVSASDSVAAIPQQIKHLEATAQRIRSSRFIATDDDFRRLSLTRYKTMVLLELDATRLGLSLTSFAGTLCTDEELGQIFSDVFSPKSSGTILKRCNSMWRFSCWLQTNGRRSPFNQSEDVVYSYICHLRVSDAGSTTPSQFIEALRFSDSLLGFCKRTLQDMLSARVLGAAHAMYLTKRVRKPAEVLQTEEVRMLELICMQDEFLHHRVIAGHLLFCLMTAARWHDSMHVISMELSRAEQMILVEALTAKHKSSRTKELQRELLPFTALGQALETDSKEHVRL